MAYFQYSDVEALLAHRSEAEAYLGQLCLVTTLRTAVHYHGQGRLLYFERKRERDTWLFHAYVKRETYLATYTASGIRSCTYLQIRKKTQSKRFAA